MARIVDRPTLEAMTDRELETATYAPPIQLPELVGLPRVEWRESLWYTRGYAIDGADALRFFVDEKGQRHGLVRLPLDEVLRDRKTPTRVKRWLRAQRG